MAAGERARTVADLLRPADELHLVVPSRAARRPSSPSHEPVTKTRTRSRSSSPLSSKYVSLIGPYLPVQIE